MSPEITVVIRILQASISPIALVSGVGLVLLSLTNRFGRVTDRIRDLARIRRDGAGGGHIEEQIEILRLRARIIRMAISSAVSSMLIVSLLTLVLFATAVFAVHGEALVLLLFALSLLCLVGALLLFLWEVGLSLHAVQQELAER